MSTTIHKWKEEEIDYLKEIALGRSYKEIAELVNNKFGYSLSVGKVKGALIRNKIRTGRDSTFKKGHEPSLKGTKGVLKANSGSYKKGASHLSKPVGSERVRKGCVEVKVGNPNKWERKHRLIWESINGPVPEGHVIVFADKNRLNFDIDNLLLVSKQELCRMNAENYIIEDSDFTKAALLNIRLKQRVKELSKELNAV